MTTSMMMMIKEERLTVESHYCHRKSVKRAETQSMIKLTRKQFDLDQ